MAAISNTKLPSEIKRLTAQYKQLHKSGKQFPLEFVKELKQLKNLCEESKKERENMTAMDLDRYLHVIAIRNTAMEFKIDGTSNKLLTAKKGSSLFVMY